MDRVVRVLAGFAFALAHGLSAAVALRLRGERELERIRALLDLSQSSAGVMYVSLMVLLIAGIAAGFVARLWGRGWIWTAIVLLVALLAIMSRRGAADATDERARDRAHDRRLPRTRRLPVAHALQAVLAQEVGSGSNSARR